MTLYSLLLIIPIVIALWFHHQRNQRRAEQKRQVEKRAKENNLVPCFTCGLKIPKEGALEKKGRYFCGVKKQDRERMQTTDKYPK
ncbi:MAG: hypothetical protein OQL20_13030 [Sedimenticola sp.]|nr:hypothetical protein [Sedimenticola sp.]